jgi:hypothetical protein
MDLRDFLWHHWHSHIQASAEPDEDYPSQTLGPYLPDGKLPARRLADSEIKDPKYYKLILVEDGKAVGDTI